MLDTSGMVEQLSLIVIFVEGLMSFLSPCVLPMVPIYLGYLSSHQQSRKKTILFTISFIVGILVALLLLNASMGLLSAWLKDVQAYFMLIGGLIVVVMGLVQLGVIQIPFLQQTYRLPSTFQKSMSVFGAFLMGFCFSFAWTPCIGPALTSILLLASSTQEVWMSYLYMLVYAAGLCIPFIIVACFSDVLLKKLQNKGTWMKVAAKVGALIILLFGSMMIFKGVEALKHQPTPNTQEQASSEEDSYDQALQTLLNYKVNDLEGNQVSFQDVKGKYVFVNYWATWCPPCQSEMPDLQALYDKYKDLDVAVITITLPDQKQSLEDIQTYIQDQGYTMPVWIDDGFFSSMMNITSLPTSYVFQPDGQPYGYVSGALSLEMMENMIQQVKNAQE